MIVRTKNGIISSINIEDYITDKDLYKMIINFKFNIKFENDNNIEDILKYING